MTRYAKFMYEVGVAMFRISFETLYLAWAWRKAHRGIKCVPDWQEFANVIAAYDEEHRHYHTVSHLVDLVRFTGQYKEGRDSSLLFAIFYHDFVYEIGSKTNESKSADRWLVYANKLRQGRKFTESVATLILLTISHKAPADDQLAKILLDADLNVLSKNWPQYLKYARNIWKEYSSVGQEIYKTNRIAFLTKAYDAMEYNTPKMKKRIFYMRTNLADEKELLLKHPEQIFS